MFGRHLAEFFSLRHLNITLMGVDYLAVLKHTHADRLEAH